MTPPAGQVASETRTAPFRPLPMRKPDVDLETRADGTLIIRSRHAPGEGPRSIAALFAERAGEHPGRPFILQRAPGGGPWSGVTYGEALAAADAIAQWLIDRGLGADDAVLVLSGNSVKHGLVMLGAYAAGVPIAPISPAYSLVSTDFAKLIHCFRTVRPRAVYAEAGAPFARAVAALRAEGPDFVFVTGDGEGEGAVALAEVLATAPGPEVARRRAALGPASVAKVLFTSGSTGAPKGVQQTHGMMSAVIAGQEGLRDPEAETPADPPVALEWMPWSHISAGNIGFNGNLWAGGTLYLDEGRPIPGQFEATIRNLYEVSPRVFGSAPIAFSMLAEAMERDSRLRAAFFRNLVYMGYGGATLSNDVYDRMQALAVAETGQRIPITTMYGATETQGVTVVHWETERVGLVGLPLPGVTLKLVPNGAKLEVRVKGPTVTPGYHRDPGKTAEAFDEEGFYRLGDAARLLDPEDAAKGLVFDGRVTEDFKLDTGTWVSVGTLRPDVIAACAPFVQDAVIAGQDKPFAAALLWPSAAALADLASEADPLGAVADRISDRLAAFNASAGGSSRRIGRFTVMNDPLSIDAGEITDKGYVNQRATLDRRAALVASIYADPPGRGVRVPGAART